jgi:hypothetical protein
MAWRFDCPVCRRHYKLKEAPRRRLVKCLTWGKMIRLAFRLSARMWTFYQRSRN